MTADISAVWLLGASTDIRLMRLPRIGKATFMFQDLHQSLLSRFSI